MFMGNPNKDVNRKLGGPCAYLDSSIRPEDLGYVLVISPAREEKAGGRTRPPYRMNNFREALAACER